MAYKENAPIIVGEGGSGVTSHTSYAVLCGGTTATGGVQSIAGVGTSGQVLTSNGASALPTFQAAAGGAVLTSKVPLTNSQVKNLATTPIQLVAAPGSSKAIQIVSASLKLVYGGNNAFTVGSVGIRFLYTNNSGALGYFIVGTGAGWLDQTASTTCFVGYQNAEINNASSTVENQALVIGNVGSNVGGNASNDNTVIVNISYVVLDFS